MPPHTYSAWGKLRSGPRQLRAAAVRGTACQSFLQAETLPSAGMNDLPGYQPCTQAACCDYERCPAGYASWQTRTGRGILLVLHIMLLFYVHLIV